jgi:hypothetical protein
VKSIQKVFQKKVEVERKEFSLLQFLRKKYQLMDIKNDRYLGRAYA